MATINILDNMQTEAPAKKISPARKWGMLMVLSLALCIIILDTTILNVALAAIIRDLHTDIQKLQWVITAYSLTLAALTITGGRLGDIFGRKRMFVFGAILFAIGSFLASISTNVGMLIAGEAIIEGIGAALMMPATASLLVANYEGRERALAFGVWGGVAGAAAALGPILGGYLATNFNWRWGFRINLLVVLALIIGSVLIPESRDTQEKKELDWLGVILSATGLLSLVFGIIEASRYGWWKAAEVFTAYGHAFAMPGDLSIVPYCIALGILILTAFGVWEALHESNGHTPLVSPSIFKNRRFTSGVITTAVMSLGQTGLIFSLPVFLQAVRGLDAFHTGLSLLPMSLALLFVAPASAVLGRKISPKFLINLGLLINVGAYIVLWRTMSVTATSWELAPGLALFGIGMGFVMSQINNLTLSAVSVQQAGEASGINNTLRQVGATLGSAIIGTILVGTLSTHLVDGVSASAVIPDAMKPAISDAVRTQTSNVEFGSGAQVGGELPAQIKEEIVAIGHQATVDANKQSLLYGAAFAFLGFLVSLLLPSKGRQKNETPIPAKQGSLAAPRELDVALIRELLQADELRRTQGLPSLGADVRLVIDAAETGREISRAVDPRLVQARKLWDAGWGSASGAATFKEYIQGIPEVPEALLRDDVRFPHLVLVDARISAIDACAILGIVPRGNHTTTQMKHLHEKKTAYWMRCNDGSGHTGKSVRDVERSLAHDERGLSTIEGLAFYAQEPSAIHARYIDLPESTHEGIENSTACLGTWDDRPELRWRWRDHADPVCSPATRLA